MKQPSADLRARVLAAAAAEPVATRATQQRRSMLAAAGGVLATAALFFGMGGCVMGTRPLDLVLFTGGLALLAGFAMARVTFGSDGMLGRSREVLIGACILVAPVLTCAALAATMIWPHALPASMQAHVGCGAATMLQGALPLVIFLLLRRGTDPVHPAITGAAIGMTAGAFGAMMAYLRCPHADATHCISAHVAPVVLLGAAGALLGRFLLRVR